MGVLTTSTAPVRVGIARCSGLGLALGPWPRSRVSALEPVPPWTRPLPSSRTWSPATAGQTFATVGRDVLESRTGLCLPGLPAPFATRPLRTHPSPLTLAGDLGKRRSAQRLA